MLDPKETPVPQNQANLSRRGLVMRAAAAGGIGAALSMMHALGLAPEAAASPAPPRDSAIGRGRKVLILGAGIAGLAAGYELDKAGFDVTILEARARVGGRNWTVRGGDAVRLMGRAAQPVAFGEGHYFNCGPARLPSHHQTILGYCRELGVPLEVEVNASRSAFVVHADGGRTRMRQIVNDTRGLVAEMLAKQANQGALDASIEGVERARLLDFLRAYGDLQPDYAFAGTPRSGFVEWPGAADAAGARPDPLGWAAITDPSTMLAQVFEENYDMQPTMFQPVGGMDQIPKAFARALESRVRLGCEVHALQLGADHIDVTWREAGHVRTQAAAFVISTLPAPLLARVRANFTQDFARALAAVELDHACKIAWQAPRFWEREQIYGGLTFMDHPVRFLWYPSYGLHSEEGVLLGCYNTGETAAAFARQSLAAQTAASRAAIDLAHPGQGAALQRPITVVWREMRYNEGPWARLSPEAPAYARLNAPEGRLFLAGDYLTHVVGWQEGAALSAQRAAVAIAARAQAENLAAPT